MKKLLAILLALMMVLLSVAALASDIEVTEKDPSFPTGYEEPEEDELPTGLENKDQDITFTKAFTVKGYKKGDTQTGKTPAHTLTFTVGEGTVSENTRPVDAPDLADAIDDLTLAEGATEGTITMHIKEFPSVGKYTYTVTETDTGVAGITYATDLELKFTVLWGQIDGTEQLVIAGISLKQGGTKTDTIQNLYEAGALNITKTVTGNMGDRDAIWEFKVDFSAEDTVRSTIAVPTDSTGKVTAAQDTDGTAAGIKSIAPGTDGWKTKTVYVYLKHGQNVEFDNLPAGVTYTVTETAVEGYTTTPSDRVCTGDIAAETLAEADYTNDRTTDVDTGIALDSTIYMLIMALALAGFVALKIRRREEN